MTLSEVTFPVDLALLRHICASNKKTHQATLGDVSLCATKPSPPPEQEQGKTVNECVLVGGKGEYIC